MKKLIIVAISIILLVAISFTVVAMNTVKCSPWAEEYFEECGIKSTFGKDASKPIMDVEAVNVIKKLGYDCDYESSEYLTHDELLNILLDTGLLSSERFYESFRMIRDSGFLDWVIFQQDDCVSKEMFLAVMTKIANVNDIPAENVGAAFEEVIF